MAIITRGFTDGTILMRGSGKGLILYLSYLRDDVKILNVDLEVHNFVHLIIKDDIKPSIDVISDKLCNTPANYLRFGTILIQPNTDFFLIEKLINIFVLKVVDDSNDTRIDVRFGDDVESPVLKTNQVLYDGYPNSVYLKNPNDIPVKVNYVFRITKSLK